MSAFGDLPLLEYLQLNNNQLGGTVPDAIGTLVQLRMLNLGNNLLTGSVPDIFSALTSLTNLGLRNNSLQGPLPWPALLAMPNLVWVDLSYNRLSGSIPAAVGNMTALLYLCAAPPGRSRKPRQQASTPVTEKRL